ncbi:MAG: GOLPH3/VPS74 family protein [Flammeovirgaceae bacterium]
MKLNLPEALLLIALDDHSGKFITENIRLSYSLGGAILLELSKNNRIEIADDRVKLVNSTPMRNELLNQALESIKAVNQAKKVDHWIMRFGNKAAKIRKTIIQDLVERGVLEKREEKFLWVFTNHKYPTQNPDAENAVRKRLKAVVLQQQPAEEIDILLLSLLKVCKLTKEVFGEAAKDSHVQERIIQLIEKEEIGKGIRQAVQNIETAITVTTTMIAINAAIQ